MKVERGPIAAVLIAANVFTILCALQLLSNDHRENVCETFPYRAP